MKEPKEENLLYFGDNEIVKEKKETKQVFVTKRINGKESHNKIEVKAPKETEYKRVPNTQGFNFEREIVIGVNNKRNLEDDENRKSNRKRKNKNLNKKKNKDTVNNKNRVKEINKKQKNNIKKNSNNKKNGKNNFYNSENIDILNKINQKKEKKNKVKRTLTKVFLFLVLCIAVIVMALVTPIFNITQINVEGNFRVSTTSIINLAEINLGQNLFRNNKKKVIKNIKENSYIEEATMKRILPGTIQIKITEREIEYQIKLISSYIYIDKSGNILENSETKANVMFIEGYSTSEEALINEKKLNDEDINKLKKVLKIKEAFQKINDLDLSTVSINIKNENNFIIYVKSQNKKIYIGNGNNLTNKMLYVEKIMEVEKEHPGSIFINGDLNEGFKPYFREETIEN